MRIPRIYVDTSVIGGCFDAEFSQASWNLIGLARSGHAVLLVSDILIEELLRAPDEVRALLDEIPERCLERVFASEESMRLRDRYLSSGVVGPSCSSDAHHVAIATVVGADLLVSWNFKHLVHYAKIRGFSGVNLLDGYSPVEIRTPREVASDAEDQSF